MLVAGRDREALREQESGLAPRLVLDPVDDGDERVDESDILGLRRIVGARAAREAPHLLARVAVVRTSDAAAARAGGPDHRACLAHAFLDGRGVGGAVEDGDQAVVDANDSHDRLRRHLLLRELVARGL